MGDWHKDLTITQVHTWVCIHMHGHTHIHMKTLLYRGSHEHKNINIHEYSHMVQTTVLTDTFTRGCTCTKKTCLYTAGMYSHRYTNVHTHMHAW